MKIPWVGRGLRAVFFFTLLGFGLGAVPLRADEPVIDARSAAVLAAASAFYAGLQSFQVDGVVTMKVERPGSRSAFDEGFTMAMARPGSFAFVKTSGINTGTALVSDGKLAKAYLSLQKEYLSAAAPEDFSELITSTTLMNYGRVLVNASLFKALLAKYPFGTLATSRATGVYIGSEKIGNTDADHLQLTELGAVSDLWFASGSSPVLLQYRWTFTRPGSAAADPAAPKSEQDYVFSNWKLNPAVPAEQFAFDPPTDAAQVEAFSMPGQKEEAPSWLKKSTASP